MAVSCAATDRPIHEGEHPGAEPPTDPRQLDLARGAVDPGRAAVVDIDGVLSDASSRQHYLEYPRRDWRGFFDACGDDPVIAEVKTVLDLLDDDLRIVLLTARPHRVHDLTEAWLRALRHPLGSAVDAPLRRLRAQHRFQAVVGVGAARPRLDPVLAFEDDRRNVAMFRAEGIPTLYVHSGYFD